MQRMSESIPSRRDRSDARTAGCLYVIRRAIPVLGHSAVSPAVPMLTKHPVRMKRQERALLQICEVIEVFLPEKKEPELKLYDEMTRKAFRERSRWYMLEVEG